MWLRFMPLARLAIDLATNLHPASDSLLLN
jgi:hypothetical protein